MYFEQELLNTKRLKKQRLSKIGLSRHCST